MEVPNNFYDYKIILRKSLRLFKQDFVNARIDPISFRHKIKCYFRFSRLHNLLEGNLDQVNYFEAIRQTDYKSLLVVLRHYQDKLIEDLRVSFTEFSDKEAIRELSILCSILENLPYYNKMLCSHRFNKIHARRIAREIKMIAEIKVALEIYEKPLIIRL